MTEKINEREQFYYGKGYLDGRIAIVEEIMKDIYEIDDCLYNDDYASGYNTAISKVIDVVNKVAESQICPFCGCRLNYYESQEETLKARNRRSNDDRI